LRKKKPPRVMPHVPQARSSRKALGSPGKKTEPRREKKKALRPNAASGKAVAVPRCWGQLRADVLTAAAKAMQPPRPDMYENRHRRGTEPEALS
jgi:hypothetical protein